VDAASEEEKEAPRPNRRLKRKLRRAMRQLPETDRQVVELAYSGMPKRRIALLLDAHHSSVVRRTKRAEDKLRTLVKRPDVTPDDILRTCQATFTEPQRAADVLLAYFATGTRAAVRTLVGSGVGARTLRRIVALLPRGRVRLWYEMHLASPLHGRTGRPRS
jgi:Sigma-70, region 4